MNESQRSTEYIFQGTMYFFRREKILCRYQFALQDAVEPALLQRALEAALSAAPYYRVQLVQEKRSFFLEPNPNPCLVYQGSAQRDIPEETNGYLFSVSCEGTPSILTGIISSWTATGCRPSSPAFWNSTATCAMARRLQTRPSCAARPMTSRP